MDHDTAIRTQAAERYVLDEFSAEERADFEEHYFTCVACADEVRSASILAANAKAVLEEEHQRTVETLRSGQRARWWSSWPLLASAALNAVLLVAVVAGIGGRRQGPTMAAVEPQFYHSFGMAATSRSAIKSYTVAAGTPFFGARFDVLPGQRFDSYEYQILDAAGGASRATKSLEAPAGDGSELELAVPVSSLPPGEYSFVLRGIQQGKSVELLRAHLTIRR